MLVWVDLLLIHRVWVRETLRSLFERVSQHANPLGKKKTTKKTKTTTKMKIKKKKKKKVERERVG